MKINTAACLLLLAVACAGSGGPSGDAVDARQPDPSSIVLVGASETERQRFREGDRLFEVTMRAADGLGPLYIRTSCANCHREDGRGPGLVGKMSVVGPDGFTPIADQTRLLPFGHTQRPYVIAGATTPIGAPDAEPSVRVTFRLPPPVFGRGYLEAVDDEEILRLEREAQARTDGVRGRIHRVSFASQANTDTSFHAHKAGDAGLIWRFGLKARIATIDDFTADAFQGDMGMTSPMRITEPPNPDGLMDDAKPGIDVSLDTVNAVADYMRLLEIPKRQDDGDAGRAVFARVGCATCHVPSLRTRADYPIAALAGIDAPVFTDFLLHDMGPALADGLADGNAGSREWRTAPLMGVRFFPNLLHDGRAHSVEEAIAAHGGPESEGSASAAAFAALSVTDKQTLLKFVNDL